jgi:diaminopimelate decarboxylase
MANRCDTLRIERRVDHRRGAVDEEHLGYEPCEAVDVVDELGLWQPLRSNWQDIAEGNHARVSMQALYRSIGTAIALLRRLSGRMEGGRVDRPLTAPERQSSQLQEEWRELAAEAAARFGTPCYLSRWRPVLSMVQSLERALDGTRSWLSFKTHPIPDLARSWIRSGRGVEVVSEAEFVTLRGLGCPIDQLLVNGVAKHSWLPHFDAPELQIHFDSVAEARALLPTAQARGWRVGLRCHVPPEGDQLFGGQFGLSADEIADVHRMLRAASLPLSGLHFHLGQGPRGPAPYTRAMRYIGELCRAYDITPRYIDCGGGIDSQRDLAAAFDDVRAAMDWATQNLPSVAEVWLENGRHITRSSAALIVRVLDVKERPECRYLICDGGRTNQALDADNGPHTLLAVPVRHATPSTLTTITGPTCMTDDRLGRIRLSDTICAGDLLVWLDAGAYHLPWETRFSHGLCAVVWADENEALSLVRQRESPHAWSSIWTAFP